MKANKQNWVDFVSFLEQHKGTLTHKSLIEYAKTCSISTNAGTLAKKHGFIDDNGQYRSALDSSVVADTLILKSREYGQAARSKMSPPIHVEEPVIDKPVCMSEEVKAFLLTEAASSDEKNARIRAMYPHLFDRSVPLRDVTAQTIQNTPSMRYKDTAMIWVYIGQDEYFQGKSFGLSQHYDWELEKKDGRHFLVPKKRILNQTV